MSILQIEAPHPATELSAVSHKGTLDTLGATASIACAVHCAIVALALGLLPVLGFMANPWIDIAFLGATAAIGIASLVPSWLHHHQRVPLQLFVTGLAVLLVARLPDTHVMLEFVLVLAGAAFVVRAHWVNRTLLRSCAHSH